MTLRSVALLLLVACTRAAKNDNTIKIGAQFPIYNTKLEEDGGGRRRRAAFLLALAHLNNPADGFFDTILPDYTLEAYVYDSKRDDGNAVVNAFSLWKDDGIKALVGPASSGPSKAVQNVFKLDLIGIPQIGYSATSAELSDGSVYPLFSRTPPSDAYQAKVIKEVICHYKWNFVCTLAGSDSYSSAGIKEFISAAKSASGPACPALRVVESASFIAATPSVAEEVRGLKAKGCKVVVLFAQGSDMKNIFLEAAAQQFTAADAGVLWFASELLAGQYAKACTASGTADCDRVIKGALLVTPNFGPGTGAMYPRVADAWHAQTTSVGSSTLGRTDLGGCDAATDGRDAYLWQAQSGTPTYDNGKCASGAVVGCKCAAVNFTDVDAAHYVAGSKYEVETAGDGRISNYVPYAYDALLAVAHGLHDVLYGSHGRRTPVGAGFTGAELHAAMVNATFDGWSGSVSFTPDGDRNAAAQEFFVYSHGGDGAFHHFGSYKDKALTTTADPTWPSGADKPDERPPCAAADFAESVGDGADNALLAGTAWPKCNDEGLVYSRTFTAACVAAPFSAARPCCTAGAMGESNAPLECYYVPRAAGLAVATVVVCALGAATNALGLAWLIARRKSRAVKAGQFEFLVLYTGGCLVVSLAPLAFLGEVSGGACAARLLLFNVGVAVCWTSLAVKVWRVWRIFDNTKHLRTNTYTTKKMLGVASRLLAVELAVVVLWMAVPTFRPKVEASIEAVAASVSGFSYEVGRCTSDSNIMIMLQGVVHAVAILSLAAVSWRARGAPTAFQESQWLALILMEVVTVGGIVVVVYYALSDNLAPKQLVLVQAVGTNINTVLGCLLMLVPKALGKHEYLTAEAKQRQQQSQQRSQRSSLGASKAAAEAKKKEAKKVHVMAAVDEGGSAQGGDGEEGEEGLNVVVTT